MGSTRRALRAAFLEDHQHMITGLHYAVQALRRDDLPTAVRAAEALDRTAGPHIAFEEEVLYPTLREVLGERAVGRLFEEHGTGQTAVATLLGLAPESQLDSTRRDALGALLDQALEHALTCGELLVHVDALEPARHARMLESLERFRARPRRWTDRRGPPTPPSQA